MRTTARAGPLGSSAFAAGRRGRRARGAAPRACRRARAKGLWNGAAGAAGASAFLSFFPIARPAQCAVVRVGRRRLGARRRQPSKAGAFASPPAIDQGIEERHVGGRLAAVHHHQRRAVDVVLLRVADVLLQLAPPSPGCSGTPRAASAAPSREEAISITRLGGERRPGPRRAARAAPRSPARPPGRSAPWPPGTARPCRPCAAAGCAGCTPPSSGYWRASRENFPSGTRFFSGGHRLHQHLAVGALAVRPLDHLHRRVHRAVAAARGRLGRQRRVPAVLVQRVGHAAAAPLATGPCRYSSSEPGSEVTLAASGRPRRRRPSGVAAARERSSARKPARAKPTVHCSARAPLARQGRHAGRAAPARPRPRRRAPARRCPGTWGTARRRRRSRARRRAVATTPAPAVSRRPLTAGRTVRPARAPRQVEARERRGHQAPEQAQARHGDAEQLVHAAGEGRSSRRSRS